MERNSPEADSQLCCAICEMPHNPVPIPAGYVARCSRCGSEMRRHRMFGSDVVLAFSLAALVCWSLAAWFPLAEVEMLGLLNSEKLLAIGSDFREQGHLLLGVIADLSVVVLPSFLLLAVPLLSLATMMGQPIPAWRIALVACEFAKRWCMPEVFLLAILVAFIKIGKLAEATVRPGFWFLAASIGLLILAMQIFNPDAVRMKLGGEISSQDPRPDQPKRQTQAWAFLIAACFMLIPANTLPIMIISAPSGDSQDTILSGIAKLAESGMWGIAAIVFIASILVPFGKLGGLVWLGIIARRKGGNRYVTKMHRFLDFIGRWSMLDIFLIGLLAGLIDFGQLAAIQIGPAAPAFAAAVILTVIAVENFDTRSLWPRVERRITDEYNPH